MARRRPGRKDHLSPAVRTPDITARPFLGSWTRSGSAPAGSSTKQHHNEETPRRNDHSRDAVRAPRPARCGPGHRAARCRNQRCATTGDLQDLAQTSDRALIDSALAAAATNVTVSRPAEAPRRRRAATRNHDRCARDRCVAGLITRTTNQIIYSVCSGNSCNWWLGRAYRRFAYVLESLCVTAAY